MQHSGLRKVDRNRFRSEHLVVDGKVKVYELDEEGYSGVFKDADNLTYDMRPEEGKPCLRLFQQKDLGELRQMLL